MPDQSRSIPRHIVERESGAIHLLMTWNRGEDRERDIIDGSSKDSRRVYATSSTDQGLTWSNPKEITGEVKQSDWTW